MNDRTTRILDAALQLPEAARAELAAVLIDSVGDGSTPETVDAAWIAEAKRRLAAVERGDSLPVPLEDMMARLRSKSRRPTPDAAQG